MEDAVVQRLCLEFARQVLVPAASPSAASSTAAPRKTSAGMTALTTAAQAVGQRAITLHRLCRSPRYAVEVSSRTGASTSSASGSSGDSTRQDAAFCVCAALSVLQPTLWTAMRWRALQLRRRSPGLLFGTAPPVRVLLSNVDRFVERSASVLPARPAAAQRPDDATSTGQTLLSAAAVPYLSALQAERVAACYFYAVMTAQERQRHPQILQVAASVAAASATAPPPRTRDARAGAVDVEVHGKLTEASPSTPEGRPRHLLNERMLPPPLPSLQQQQQRHGPLPFYFPLRPAATASASAAEEDTGGHSHNNSNNDAGRARRQDRERELPLAPTRPDEARTRGQEKKRAREQPASGSDALTGKCVRGSRGDEYISGRADNTEKGSVSRTGVDGAALDDSNDDAEEWESRSDATSTSDAACFSDDAGPQTASRATHHRSARGRGDSGTRARQGPRSPEEEKAAAVWARLYAAALGDEAGDGQTQAEPPSEDELDDFRGTAAGASAVPAGLFASRGIGLQELAAETEQARHELRRARVASCCGLPLLFHRAYRPLGSHSENKGAHASPAAPVRDGLPSLADLHDQLGSTYSSRCHLARVSAGHFLFPARVESEDVPVCLYGDGSRVVTPGGLLPGPPSLVTDSFLWTRLLVCAMWLHAYEAYLLPLFLAACHQGARRDAGDDLKLAVASPELTTTLSFCVSVVQEARQYGSVTCPVCGTLASSATLPPGPLNAAAPRPADAAQDLVAASQLSRVALRWLSLREDRRQLWARMRRLTETADSFAGADADLTETAEELREEEEVGGDATATQLRRCWRHFSRATSAASAALTLDAALGTTDARQRGTADRSEEEDTASQLPGRRQQRRTLLLMLAERLVPTVLHLTRGANAPAPAPPRADRCAVTPVKQTDLRGLPLRALVAQGMLRDSPAEHWAPILLKLWGRQPSSSSALAAEACVAGGPLGPRLSAVQSPEDGTTDGGTYDGEQAIPLGQRATSVDSAGEPAASEAALHTLRAVLPALRELLDFVPVVPPLAEADGVLECARCFSLFHQSCVGPVQRDLSASVFLCHSCRLRGADSDGVRVTALASRATGARV